MTAAHPRRALPRSRRAWSVCAAARRPAVVIPAAVLSVFLWRIAHGRAGPIDFIEWSQPPVCPCDGDADGNGAVDAVDVSVITACAAGDCAGCAGTCDVNCDGAVDQVDVDVSACLAGGGSMEICCGPAHAGEHVESDIDWSDMTPNVAVGDDFVADGRPIAGLRWWGGPIGTGARDAAAIGSVRAGVANRDPANVRTGPGPAGPVPPIDGWLIGFHLPPPPSPLGGRSATSTRRITLQPEPASPGVVRVRSGSESFGTERRRTTLGGVSSTGPADFQWDDGLAEECVGVSGGGLGNAFGWANRFANTTGEAFTLTEVQVAFGCTDVAQGVSVGDAVDAVVWIDDAATGDMVNAVKAIQWSLPGGVHANDGATFATHVIPGGGVVIPVGAEFYVGFGDVQTELDAQIRFPAALDQTTALGNSWVFFDSSRNAFDPDGLAGQTIGLVDDFGVAGNWLVRANAVFVEEQAEPLALYFCDAAAVAQTPVVMPSCDGLAVNEYAVDLSACCLVHAGPDPRTGSTPGTSDAFLDAACLTYVVDVQAIVGQTFRFNPVSFACEGVPTGNVATGPVWGWRTSPVSRLSPAVVTSVSSAAPGSWLYGPWSPVGPVCSVPNMAYELLSLEPNGAMPECNQNGIPDACETDCQPNGLPDDCDIASGSSLDEDADGIPDECECAVPSVPEAVTILRSNGVPDVLSANRFLIFRAGDPGMSQAIRVTFQDLAPPFDVWTGAQLWVTAPAEVSENGSVVEPIPGSPNFTAATLECTTDPYCTDWSGVGEIHVLHEGIVPGSLYRIETVDCILPECRLDESLFSAPLELATSRWSDILESCSVDPCSPPDGDVGINDVLGIVSRFISDPRSPRKARADLEPTCVDLIVNISDALFALTAFQGLPYPFAPAAADACQAPCPSPLP